MSLVAEPTCNHAVACSTCNGLYCTATTCPLHSSATKWSIHMAQTGHASYTPHAVITGTDLSKCNACNQSVCWSGQCPEHDFLPSVDGHTYGVGHTQYTPDFDEIGWDSYIGSPNNVVSNALNKPQSVTVPPAPPPPPCHTGNIKVFSTQNITVYGGGIMHRAAGNTNVIIDLADAFYSWQVPSGWKSAQHLPILLQFRIKDGDVPLYGTEFWKDLWRDLLTTAAERGKLSVLVCCSGGHGRTGTVLALLACVANMVPKNADPVIWVREHYCDEAVETEAQLTYIREETARPVNAKVRKGVIVTQSLGYGGYGGAHDDWWPTNEV